MADPPRLWRRQDVKLGMVVTQDDIEKPDALLYKVVGICDEPTVVIAPLYERDGEEREHYVIGSPLFARFHQVRSAGEPGAFSIDFGSDHEDVSRAR